MEEFPKYSDFFVGQKSLEWNKKHGENISKLLEHLQSFPIPPENLCTSPENGELTEIGEMWLFEKLGHWGFVQCVEAPAILLLDVLVHLIAIALNAEMKECLEFQPGVILPAVEYVRYVHCIPEPSPRSCSYDIPTPPRFELHVLRDLLDAGAFQYLRPQFLQCDLLLIVEIGIVQREGKAFIIRGHSN